MYARMTVVQGSPDKVDAGIESFNAKVLPLAKGLDGYKAGFFLVDRDSGKAIGMTIWESEEARRNAGEALEQVRAATIQTIGGSVPPVDEYEVVAADM